MKLFVVMFNVISLFLIKGSIKAVSVNGNCYIENDSRESSREKVLLFSIKIAEIHINNKNA